MKNKRKNAKIENPELEAKIKDLYINHNMSARKIAKELNLITDGYVNRVLQEYDLFIFNEVGGQHDNSDKKEEKKSLLNNSIKIIDQRFPLKEGFIYIAKCKQTQEEFGDYKNYAGTLTKHILKLHPDLEIPKGYIKRRYFKMNKLFWHEKFFDIIEKEIEFKETKKCKYCEWSTVDLDNKSGAYTTHLMGCHNKNIKQYVEEFPEEKNIFKTFFDKQKIKDFINENPNNAIECLVCGAKMKKISFTHVKTHNMSLSEYKLLYNATTLSETSKKKFQAMYDNVLKMYPSSYTSKGHLEICDFLKSYNVDFKMNDKKLLQGVEVDVLIPNKKICIEYNGLLYHSEIFGKKDKNYHLNKTNLVNEKGYSLIHIFEDDWVYNQEIVKYKLKHILKLGSDSIKINARDCLITNITMAQKEQFLLENHIQGNDISTLVIGAFYKNELVSIMSFDNKRQMAVRNNSEDEYELKRFAIKKNYIIAGIANRLLKFFIINHNPHKILSFADRTWTFNTDNLYVKLGFKLDGILKPDYRYFNPKIHRNKRLHKFAYGKKALKKKYPEFYDENKSEWDIMKEVGFDRVWDCGKYRYLMEI